MKLLLNRPKLWDLSLNDITELECSAEDIIEKSYPNHYYVSERVRYERLGTDLSLLSSGQRIKAAIDGVI